MFCISLLAADARTERFPADSDVLEDLQELSVIYVFSTSSLASRLFCSLTVGLTRTRARRSVCFVRTSATAKHLCVLALPSSALVTHFVASRSFPKHHETCKMVSFHLIQTKKRGREFLLSRTRGRLENVLRVRTRKMQ
jgi:hypothetical protein